MAKPTQVTQRKRASSARRRSEPVLPREPVAQQVAGHLALDFCNTAGEHLADNPDELLRDWESFLRWATQAGLIGADSYFDLLRHPEPLDDLIALREAIYRVGLAAPGARALSSRDVVFIRERANASRAAVEIRDHTMRWRPSRHHASAQLGGVLAGEALSLLCSPNASRIGICEGGSCGWLFLDQSRGKRRRWCDMNDCGSRAKARRFYEKHKQP